MAGFTLRKGEADVEEWVIASVTAAIGDCLEIVAGDTNAATVPTASTFGYYRKGIVTKATTTSDTLVEVQVVNPSQVWEAKSTANSSATNNGANFNFATTNTITNTHAAEDESGVVQIGVIGAVADMRILVRFTDASGVDPAAA